MLLPEWLKRFKNESCLGRLGGASDISFGSAQVMRISPTLISLMGGFVLLLLCFAPGVLAEENQGASSVRTIHVIETDNAGVNLAYPSTVFYDSEGDEIYITDSAKGQVVICAADYFPQLAVGRGRGLEAIYSSYVKDGEVYFCVGRGEGEEKGYIAVFNSALIPLRKIRLAGIPKEDFLPREMVIGNNGLLYVVGVNSSAVMVLDPEGNFLREILPRDKVLGVSEEASIYSLTRDKDGRLYFLSESRGRVFVYDQNEEPLFVFGLKGGGSGKLARPRGVAVDEKNKRVFVVDYLRHTVSVYASETGKHLFEFGGLGDGRGWLYFPTDVAVDKQGHALVTDTFNQRVQVFKVIAPLVEDAAEAVAPVGEGS